MKKFIQLLFIFSVILLSAINSFAIPLHGTYTIGNGGNYGQISDALADLNTNGLGGPVIFRILSGTYQQTNYLRDVANSNSTNTITFESFAGNADSVVITEPSEYSFRMEGAKNYIIKNITLQNISMRENCQNIHILNNKFTDQRILMIDGQILGFYVKGNSALAGITLNSQGVLMQAVTISDNDFSPLASFILLNNVHNVTITGNKNLGNVYLDFVNEVDFSGNKLRSNQPGSNVVQVRESQIVYLKNNFLDSQGDAWGVSFKNNNLLECKNNTIRNEGLDTTLSAIGNSGLELQNNIYYNDSPGVSVSLWNNTAYLSDYNAYYNGPVNNLIRYNGTNFTLSGFQAATGQGLHSSIFAATFAAPGDLHLHSSQTGNVALQGIPDPDVLYDIDGQLRNPVHPYKGADEIDIALPVELSSFTSVVNGSSIVLSWTTLTESNNSGFQIEKRSGGEQWNIIAFINGKGNSNTPVNYSYTDMNLNQGNYNYRLKQIDLNGNFTYYNLSNEVVIGIPDAFSLSQNYPNPFNPRTIINYQLPLSGHVSLKIFDVLGNEVETLVNEVKPAGRYKVDFNAASLPSGIYFYKIKTGNFSEVKRMMLVK